MTQSHPKSCQTSCQAISVASLTKAAQSADPPAEGGRVVVVVVAVDATSPTELTKTSHGEPSKSSQGKDQDGDKDGLA